MSLLKISEIFCSLQGESTSLGLPTVFVRLTGCPLRCTWCDTTHAFSGGARRSLEAVLQEVAAFKTSTFTPFVCVTGGEPLAQKACLPLLTALCDAGYRVSLETSGSLDISGVDPRVVVIMDLKAPDSGEMDKNRFANLPLLKASDELKFVLASRKDYEWAKNILQTHASDIKLPKNAILFSPVTDTLPACDLAEWLLEDRLFVRFQLQLHKILWGNEIGR